MFTGLKEQLDFNDYQVTEILPQNQPLIKLKKIINWSKINKIYKSCFNSDNGRGTKQTELSIGLLILKFLYQQSDRKLISDLHINNAYMHFCSINHEDLLKIKSKNKHKLIDHSTLVKIRSRLGAKKVKEIEGNFVKQLVKLKIIDGSEMYIDTTSLEKKILYPTEISLLKRVIEHTEMIVQKIYFKNQLVKSEILKKANILCKIYYSTSKKTKDLLISKCKQLLELAETNFENAENTLATLPKSINEKLQDRLFSFYDKLNTTGKKIIRQVHFKIEGKKVNDKVVSFHEPHVRPLPKGKVGKPCEFGVKHEINLSKNGYITRHKCFKGNPADIDMLLDFVDYHNHLFGGKFKGVAADRGFYNEGLIKDIKDIYNITMAIPHKKDKNKKLTGTTKKLYNRRARIEAKISEGKRMTGMGKSLFKGFEGDEIWGTLSIFALNLKKLLRDIEKKPKLMECFQ